MLSRVLESTGENIGAKFRPSVGGGHPPPGAHTYIYVIYSGRFPPSGDATSALRALQEHIPSLIKEKNTLKMVLERRNMVQGDFCEKVKISHFW